jgi:hypothetical protein
MSGHWPPEWEDPEEESPEETDQLDATVLAAGGEARLSEVAAFLASVPAPALPDAVEARISAALTAEAATRADQAASAAAPTAAADSAAFAASSSAPVSPAAASAPAGPASASADRSRKLGTSRVRPRARRPGSGRPRREFRVPPKMAAGTLIACLLFAGLGYAISRSGPQSSYSTSAGAPAAGTSAEGASSAAASSAAGAASVPSTGAAAPRPATTARPEAGFAVIMSGTKYTQATLAEQVRTRLAANGGQQTSEPKVPAASATSAGAGPSQALQGCVLHLTDGAVPRLVDRATYQGQAAYVIASSSHVWVVGPGCTEAKTELVASVPLAGLPGNLRALISVEHQRRTS